MTRSRTISLACSLTLILASAASAQRRVAPGSQPQRPTVAVTIALKAGADAYDFNGQGSCTHAPVASIYQTMAEMWSVEQSEGARSMHLTLWKPRNGSGDMFSLSVSGGGGSHQVDTVKAPGSSPKGSGTVTFAASGSGGTFTVNAKAADGAAITGTIKCAAFSPAMAEGGD